MERESFDFAEEGENRKRVLRRGFEIFQGYICLFKGIRYDMLNFFRHLSLSYWA